MFPIFWSRMVIMFPLNITVAANSALDATRMLQLKTVAPQMKPAGQASSFELTTLLNGEPVAWAPYDVHQFVLKTDWSYFKHDHPGEASELGVGSVRSSFMFPAAGDYVLFQFLETGVQVGTETLRPTLRFPGIVQVSET
jgi:hypothetical protein